MAYAIEFSPESEEDLRRLSPVVASYVLDQIERLAQDPLRLSSPGSFPYPLAQQYRFDDLLEGHRHYFVVLF